MERYTLIVECTMNSFIHSFSVYRFILITAVANTPWMGHEPSADQSNTHKHTHSHPKPI